MTIFHVALRTSWESQKESGRYVPSQELFVQEGFIHMSTKEQVVSVLNRFYTTAEATSLLLLVIDESSEHIAAHLKWEDPIHPVGQSHVAEIVAPAQQFPHLYAPLDSRAVLTAVALERDEHGQFFFPAAV